LEPIKKPRPQKWDTKAQRVSKKLSKRKKLAILQSYEDKMAKGHDRAKILEQLEKRLGVSGRQVERILSQARHYAQEIKEHHAQLSATALKLADILSKYHEHSVTIIPFITEGFPYKGLHYEILPFGGSLVESAELDRKKVSNLVSHLKAEMPELVSITKYPEAFREWFALPDDEKLKRKPPEVTITEDLILKLRLKGNQGDFCGKCPDCPR